MVFYYFKLSTYNKMNMLILICIFIVMVNGNSLSGTFQSCTLQCSNTDQIFPPHPSPSSINMIQGKSGPRGEKGEPGVRGKAGKNYDIGLITQLQNQLNNLTEDLRSSQEEVIKLKETIANLTDAVTKTRESVKTSVIGTDCKKLLGNGNTVDGVYTLLSGGTLFPAWCEMQNGGWTVFQRRFDGSTDFRQNFQTFTNGFGNVNAEYWLGLEKLHQMTKTGRWQLRIDLLAFDGDEAYAQYNDFSIGPGPGYQLRIGAFSGTAGDSMTRYSSGMKFTTEDKDQDNHNSLNCAQYYEGSWWTKHCHDSNLNSFVYGSGQTRSYHGMIWEAFKGRNTPLKESTMKFRPVV